MMIFLIVFEGSKQPVITKYFEKDIQKPAGRGFGSSSLLSHKAQTDNRVANIGIHYFIQRPGSGGESCLIPNLYVRFRLSNPSNFHI